MSYYDCFWTAALLVFAYAGAIAQSNRLAAQPVLAMLGARLVLLFASCSLLYAVLNSSTSPWET